MDVFVGALEVTASQVQDNLYRPPLADLEVKTTRKKPSRVFIFVFALRWIVSVCLMVYSAERIRQLVLGWSFLADRTIIVPAYNPYFLLLLNISSLIVAMLLLLRSKWVFVPLVCYSATFLLQVFRLELWKGLPGDLLIFCGAQFALLFSVCIC